MKAQLMLPKPNVSRPGPRGCKVPPHLIEFTVELAPPDRCALRHIVKTMEVIATHTETGYVFIMAAVPAKMIDTLAAFEAELEELHPDYETEEETDLDGLENGEGDAALSGIVPYDPSERIFAQASRLTPPVGSVDRYQGEPVYVVPAIRAGIDDLYGMAPVVQADGNGEVETVDGKKLVFVPMPKYDPGNRPMGGEVR